jgi:DUF4097 and DUF4098 domain-containing protein YvlB
MSAILVLSIAGILASEERESRTIRKTLSLPPGKTIAVHNRNGDVSVTGWNKDSVEVVAEIQIRGRHRRDFENVLNQFQIRTDDQGGRLRIDTDPPESEGGNGFWDWLLGKRIQVSVSFRIRAPERSDLELKTTNGGVDATLVRGKLRLGTTNGDVRIDDAAGSVDAETTNGSIHVQCGKILAGDRLSCRTTNGDVTLTLSKKAAAEVDLSTVNGHTTCGLPLTVQGGISGTHVRGRIGQGGGSIHCSTVNGSIRLSGE